MVGIKKIFEILLGIVIFLSATAYLPGKGFDEAQGIVFRIGITALLIVSFYLKPIRFVVNKWLNMILGSSLILTLFLIPSIQTIALNPFINILLGVILFYLITNYAEEEIILNAFCWVVAINSFMVALQAMGIDPIVRNVNGNKPDLTGLFEYRYALGVYMSVLAPFLLASKRKVFGVIAGILAICSMSFAAIGVMAVSCLILLYKFKKILFRVAVSIFIFLAVGIFVVSSVPNNHPLSIVYKIKSRVDIHNKFLPVIMQKPMGYGLGCFKHIGPLIVNNKNSIYGNVTDGWSDYLERTMELGFIFLLLFWFLCKDVFNRGGIILLGIPLNMMFHSCFNHFNVSVLFIVLFAVWEIRQYRSQ